MHRTFAPENLFWVGLGPLNTLVDVLGQIRQANVEELLFVVCDLANWMDLLDTIWTELNERGEEVAAAILVEWAVDESWLDNTLLALSSLEQALGEASTGHGHGEGSRSSTILGLDDLVTTELHTVDVGVELLALQVVAGLRQKWDDGLAGVTTDDGDALVGWVGALDLGDEAGGTDNVKGGDTKETLGVVDTLGLEDLGGDGDGGVDLKFVNTRFRAAADAISVRGWR